MFFNKKENIPPQKFIKIFESGIFSLPSKSASDFIQDPCGLLIYNQFLEYTKEDLKKLNKTKNLYNIFLEHKNSILVTSLLDKELEENFSTEVISIYKNFPEKTLALADFVFEFESKRLKTDIDLLWKQGLFGLFKNEKSEKNLNFIVNELIKNDLSLIDMLNFLNLDANYQNKEVVINFFKIAKNNGVDLLDKNKDILKVFLPVSKSKEDEFFISVLKIKEIKFLVSLGFKFPTKYYKFNGDSLIIAVIKSRREDLISLIIPNVDTCTPSNADWETQNYMINSLDEYKYKELKDIYYNKTKEAMCHNIYDFLGNKEKKSNDKDTKLLKI